jgi:DNA-binding transcriptional LysR family regulator
MDKLKHMKTFMLIVESGSIAKAAQQLGISKAAASKQLNDLENKMSVALLERTTRKHKLTDIGDLYYEALKNVFANVAEAESIASQSHEKPVGTLRIASHRHFGERFIIDRLQEFNALYPDLKLDIELADRFPDLEKENFDVLCGIGHEGPDHLVRKKIATIRHILCATPDYLTKYGVPKSPDDLKHHRYITHSFRNPDNLLQFKNGKEVHVNYHIRLNDAQAMLNCTLQGLGYTKIFDYYIDEHLKCGKLVEILREFREPEKSLYIFYRHQKYTPMKIRIFVNFLYKQVNAESTFASNKYI